MSRNRFSNLTIISALVAIAMACAKVSAPSGGPKDKNPPVVLKSEPVDGARNFRGKGLSVTFDEYVVLDNINDKFMVSPPMKKKPRVYIKGKSLNVDFEEKLKDSTTYTFYFQDAVKDLNEGNILENFQFVFSTGPVIDSLSVTGNVYKAFNLEVPEKTQVLMYRELADSAVVKHLPEYISRVNETGYFRIDNVRAGRYRLYALKDDNNSKNYDRVEEEFAFNDSLIMVTPEKNYLPVVKDTAKVKPGEKKTIEPVIAKGEYQLILFLAKKKDHYLIRSTRENKYLLTYIFSLPPDTMKVDFSIPGAAKDSYFIEQSRLRDTMKVWLTDSTLYSLAQDTTILRYPFTDTLGVVGYKTDTIPMRFVIPKGPKPARAAKAVKAKKTVFNASNNMASGYLRPGESVVFKSETPFRQPDTTRIRLYEIIEKENKRIKVPFLFVRDSLNSCRYGMKAKLLQGKNYLFIADSAAFGNIYHETSDSTGIKFSVKDTESYSKLILTISNCKGPTLIQLLDNSEKLISEKKISKDVKIEFSLLDVGSYRIRAISDLNGDGLWTTGDFSNHRQPEPVTYYPSEVEIRAGYIVDQDWDISQKNFKDQKLREKPKKQ